jgi:hypothetical protein
MRMVGGGSVDFIGPVHRVAAMLDHKIELVCGCIHMVPELSWQGGCELFLPENRDYDTYH